MKDICYECGTIQDYGTMKDTNECDFEILCESCFEKRIIRANISGKLEVNPLNSHPLN